jgi:hypothetical protein
MDVTFVEENQVIKKGKQVVIETKDLHSILKEKFYFDSFRPGNYLLEPLNFKRTRGNSSKSFEGFVDDVDFAYR